MIIESNILTIITFLPLFGALVVLVVPGNDAVAKANMRRIALVATLVTFAFTLLMWFLFDPQNTGFQFVQNMEWIGGVIGYRMGVDGISMPFVVLTGLLMPMCILASWESIEVRVREYMVTFLILETLMTYDPGEGTYRGIGLDKRI